jgi:DNA invertase Pin-like site-specific DNA recombinase
MAGILVGYARVSTCDQQAGLDAQIRDLKAAGCEEIFSEQVSAVAQRDRLKEALRFVRRNDTLVATKPDRLARSTTDLLRIVDDLDRRGVGLIMLSMGGQTIDTRSPTGKLMITMLGAIAEFERGLLLERQREGVAKAKLDGKYKGRKPTARAKAAEVFKLEAEGLQRTEIARRTGIGVASVYRLLADAKRTAGEVRRCVAESRHGSGLRDDARHIDSARDSCAAGSLDLMQLTASGVPAQS